MSEHFIEKCKCGIVVNQCRCAGGEKAIRIVPCTHPEPSVIDTPGALTREQVENHGHMLADANVDWPGRESLSEALLDHDAALRATIAQQAQELECQRDKIASMRNSFPIDAASWRGVDEHDVCAECGGAGTKLYGNTSTYHYSAGGQAMTLSVCDKCWGSGNKQKPWRSWKIIEQQTQELEKLTKLYATTRSALAETSTTQEEAIRQQLAAMTRERDTWKRRAVAVTDDPEYQRCCSLREMYKQQLAAMTTRFTETAKSFNEAIKREASALQQLAASQERCREMEREIETLTTCGCEGCDDNLEESAFCFPCMNKVQQQVTQLQATLAAREARIRELEDQMNAKRYVTNEAL